MPQAQPDCVFCKIVAGDIPAKVVRDGERTLAFRDLNPQAPTHILVIPKEHHDTVAALASVDPDLTAELMREAHQAAVHDDIAESGYRLVFNTGPDANQTVLHVHCHVIGGRTMSWPPG